MGLLGDVGTIDPVKDFSQSLGATRVAPERVPAGPKTAASASRSASKSARVSYPSNPRRCRRSALVSWRSNPRASPSWARVILPSRNNAIESASTAACAGSTDAPRSASTKTDGTSMVMRNGTRGSSWSIGFDRDCQHATRGFTANRIASTNTSQVRTERTPRPP